MLKLNRKMKQDSARNRNKEEVPRNQDDAGHGTPEGHITPVAPPYLMPSANTTGRNSSGIEKKSTRRNTNGSRQSSSKNTPPPLFVYIEAGDFRHAMERAKRHPREVRTWASIKTKSPSHSNLLGDNQLLDTTKRLALHQSCLKVSAESTVCL